jgi:hypothetical protein
MSVDDRVTLLRANEGRLTGIDFVQVIRPSSTPNADTGLCDPFQIKIYFQTDVRGLRPAFSGEVTTPPPLGTPVELTLASIVIHDANGDPLVPNVPLVPNSTLDFSFDANACRSVLTISVQSPADFRNYRLRIDDPIVDAGGTTRIDPFFNDTLFSFEVGCEDNLDCKPAPLVCPVENFVDFPVDYLARDFVSLRNALLDFAGQRYPEWTLPIEADVGSVLMEIFAALGDELSYVQDRYAREAYLETATERRSLRKKARLLDYDIHDGRSATALLELSVQSDDNGVLVSTGTPVWATTEGGPVVRFEIGIGLRDPNAGYTFFQGWNAGALVPYWFDASTKCLDVGATELFVAGTIPHAELIQAGAEAGDRLMLLRSEDPNDPSVPHRRHFVHVTEITPTTDPLSLTTVTRIRWDASDALPFQIDQGLLALSLNIVAATAGERRCVDFVCGAESATNPPPSVAVEREGPLPIQTDPNVAPERPTIFLFSLPDSDTGGIGFLGPSLRETLPEVLVRNLETGEAWDHTRSLLEALEDQEAFTLEDGMWRRIVLFRTGSDEFIHQDYATGAGYTLRFGDGTFGREPARGTIFRVNYRLGPGALANVAADTITKFNLLPPATLCPGELEPTMPVGAPNGVLSVTNPWPVLDGTDPESAADIKLLTPEAYRADRFFALQAVDYGEQAQKLSFVQRANGKFRWTGSWNSVFVSADPFGSFTLSDDQFANLEEWLDCVRQAGREVIVKDPKFRTLDLEITICVQPFAYPGQVVQAVFEALLGTHGARPKKGFFDPDNFTFGVPLRRSALESAIQEVPGVHSVQRIRKRERGTSGFITMTDLTVEVAPDEVFRLENDPTHPERGSLRIRTTGGA